MAVKASAGHIKKLQVIYRQAAAREIGIEDTREARLAWASQSCKRELASFSDLTRLEAIHLIQTLEAVIGVTYRPMMSREQGRRAGRDGRRGKNEFSDSPQMVRDVDIQAIRNFIARLGWDENHFHAWLKSRSGPLGGRAEIRTTADANRVRWALRRMLVRSGLWDKDAA